MIQGLQSAPLKAVAPRYQQQYGVQVNIVEFPYDQLYEKLVTAFQANAATYDLAMIDDPWMPRFGGSAWLQAMDGSFGVARDPDIPGVVYDIGTWPPPRGPVPPAEQAKPGQLLAMAIVDNVEMFMYRKDLGGAPPRTWDDVLASAQTRNRPGFAGYVIRGKAVNPIVADFLPILWSFGGDVFDDNWNEQVDSPASINAVRFLVAQLNTVAEPGPENVDSGDRDRLIATNQAYQSTVWPAEFSAIEQQPGSQVAGKVGYVPIPAGPSGKGHGYMSSWLLGIPSSTQNGQAAIDFVKWLTSPQIQREYAAQGGIPSRRSLLNDPSLNQQTPYFAALAQSLDAAPNWRPRTDQWTTVENILGTQLSTALAGRSSPEDSMSTAAQQITATMSRAGY